MSHLLRVGSPLLAAVLLLPLTVVAADEGEALRWLERMMEAGQRLDYAGTFVYRHGSSMQTMRIAHGRVDGVERERLITLDGPPREVVRDGDRVACRLADRVLVERSGSGSTLPLFPTRRMAGLRDSYRFAFDGRERVAGLAARRVVVEPRDGYRYGHRFWIAEESGLMLHSELVDQAGAVVEELKFTAITVHDALPEELLRSETDLGSGRKLPAPAESGGRWSIARLPPAFEVVSHVRHAMGGQPEVEHLVLSDGLASVSVFIEHHDAAAEALPGASGAVGAMHTLTRAINGHRLTVVGEVPVQTVQWIADAMERPGTDR
jgi:sigma-E factor negative regulatory protein RseB